jgi:PmbA protein
VSGRKIGGARTNGRDKARLGACARRAAEIAALQADDPLFPGLASSRGARELPAYDITVASLSARDRARAVGAVVAIAAEAGLEASGALTVSADEMAIANTLSTFQYHPSTYVQLHVVARGGGAEGACTQTSDRWSSIDPERVAREAVETCVKSREAVVADSGEWAVVLQPEAVADMVELLAYMGLGGLSFVEGRSFLCGRIGERVVSESITIVDDPLRPKGAIRPFDYEGVPKRKTVIIDRGIARTAVHDSRTAARAGLKSTAHALSEPNTFGPYPTNLVVERGDASVADMIASTKRGLLVSRFHYTNPVDPRRTVITGMTRFGTFLIEDGAVTKAVRSMRFTDSVLEGLSRVEMVGRQQKRVDDILAPALKLSSWRFTGVTGD